MFRESKWIYANDSENGYVDNARYMRKEFELDKDIKSATLYIAALGYGIPYINGKRVTEDVLTTPFTKFDKSVYYNTYDVTALLNKGTNCLGVHLGNGYYNNTTVEWNFDTVTWRDQPKLCFTLSVEFTDGEKTELYSRPDMKWMESPVIYNHIRHGEIIDARMEIEGWNEVGFDDTDWKETVICRTPGGILRPALLPPPRIQYTLTPKYLENGIYDFGENITGWVRVKAKGDEGQTIRIFYSEIYKDGDIDNRQINEFNYPKNPDDNAPRNEYRLILSGKNDEFSGHFTYHGFRYVKVENAPKDFEIVAEVFHTDLKTHGTFESSSEMLNKIHKASLRATLGNYMSVPTDCPHREQNGWTGDAAISSDQALMNFEMTESYRKWLMDFKDVQRPSGEIPATIPSTGWGYNWGNGPAWDNALFVVPYNVYKIYGDKSLLEMMWENMELYMNFIYTMQDDYIIKNFGLSDWCSPRGGDIMPSEVTDVAYYYTFAKIMAEASVILNKGTEEKYKILAENIKKAWRENYLNRPDYEKYQTYFACALYQGLLEEDEIPVFAEKLANLVRENDNHIDCGILGTKYIFSALSDNGYADVAYDMVVNPTFPSYAHWILSGMTTLAESWSMNVSLNHHMFSEVDYWLYRHLGGIHLNGGKITIKPSFIPQLGWVHVTHKGIDVYWDKKTLKVAVPKEADIIINNNKYHVEKGEYTYEL